MATEVYKMGASLDSSNAPEIQKAILAVLDQEKSRILDMSDCTYVSSSGLRVMLYSYKVAAAKGNKVYLVGVSNEIRDVMSMTGFEKFFDFFNTVDEVK